MSQSSAFSDQAASVFTILLNQTVLILAAFAAVILVLGLIFRFLTSAPAWFRGDFVAVRKPSINGISLHRTPEHRWRRALRLWGPPAGHVRPKLNHNSGEVRFFASVGGHKSPSATRTFDEADEAIRHVIDADQARQGKSDYELIASARKRLWHPPASQA